MGYKKILRQKAQATIHRFAADLLAAQMICLQNVYTVSRQHAVQTCRQIIAISFLHFSSQRQPVKIKWRLYCLT
jgi:hypothetical protein